MKSKLSIWVSKGLVVLVGTSVLSITPVKKLNAQEQIPIFLETRFEVGVFQEGFYESLTSVSSSKSALDLLLENIPILKEFVFATSVFNISDDNKQVFVEERNYTVPIVAVDNDVDLEVLEVTGVKSFIHYWEQNDDRYNIYSQLYPDIPLDIVITYVNIGLDKPFYSEIKEVKNPNSNLVLVNKYNTLSADYVPSDFIGISRSLNLSKEAQENFDLMKLDASRVGIKLLSVSGYRSYDVQCDLYEGYKKRSPETADTFSARPGSSEHQTGLAVDINTASSSVGFENTKAYVWLLENAYKYGFILRYPFGKEDITGYMYEPWHWRYVGKSVASTIKESGLTFDEYIGRLPQ